MPIQVGHFLLLPYPQFSPNIVTCSLVASFPHKSRFCLLLRYPGSARGEMPAQSMHGQHRHQSMDWANEGLQTSFRLRFGAPTGSKPEIVCSPERLKGPWDDKRPLDTKALAYTAASESEWVKRWLCRQLELYGMSAYLVWVSEPLVSNDKIRETEEWLHPVLG